jgi:hypothetical protein
MQIKPASQSVLSTHSTGGAQKLPTHCPDSHSESVVQRSAKLVRPQLEIMALTLMTTSSAHNVTNI